MVSASQPAGVIGRFQALVVIDNPSGEEAAIRQSIWTALAAMGVADCHVDGEGNLLVRVPGRTGLPPVLLSAHMDSVPPCCGIVPVGDTRQGRAIIRSEGKTVLGADDKAGIAVILEVVDQLAQTGFQNNPPLELFFSVKEETGLLGGKALDISWCKATLGLVLDGEGRAGMIFSQGPTQFQLRVVVTGKSSHAGISPEAGISAIEALAHFCTLVPTGRPGGAYGDAFTTNIGVIQGGEGLNVVPAHATMIADARSHTTESATLIERAWENARLAVAEKFPGVAVAVEMNKRYDGFQIDPAHPVIRLAEQGACDIGLTPAIAAMNTGSDAHWLNRKGLPTVVLGMGFHQSHSLGEYVYTEELCQVTDWVLAILNRAAAPL